MYKVIVFAATCLLLVACGADEKSETTQGVQKNIGAKDISASTKFPLDIIGSVSFDVAEGEPYDDGYSEINFGELTFSDGSSVLVEASGSELRSAKLPPHGGDKIVIGKIEPTGQNSVYRFTELKLK